MTRQFLLGLICATAACGDNGDSNPPPALVSTRITMSVAEDSVITIDATAIDREGERLSYSASTPAHGKLTGSGPLYVYTAGADYSGSDTFTVMISDGKNVTAVPVDITVAPVDDAPVVADLSLTTMQNVPVDFMVMATDVDSTELSYDLVSPPVHGELDGEPPMVTYAPDEGFAGTDSFMFRASDGTLTSNVATATIRVIGCGDGHMDPGEACDDGNQENGDGCSNNCMVENGVQGESRAR